MTDPGRFEVTFRDRDRNVRASSALSRARRRLECDHPEGGFHVDVVRPVIHQEFCRTPDAWVLDRSPKTVFGSVRARIRRILG